MQDYSTTITVSAEIGDRLWMRYQPLRSTQSGHPSRLRAMNTNAGWEGTCRSGDVLAICYKGTGKGQAGSAPLSYRR